MHRTSGNASQTPIQHLDGSQHPFYLKLK